MLKRHTYTLFQQTKTRPQETLKIEMNRQMQTFLFNPPIDLLEECKWLLAVTSSGTTNSVFKTTDENNSFSITTPGH